MKIRVLERDEKPEWGRGKVQIPPELYERVSTLKEGQTIEIHDPEIKYSTLYTRIREKFHNPSNGFRVRRKSGKVYIEKVRPE